MIAPIFAQVTAFRLDLLSFFLGAIAGVLVWWGVVWVRPFIHRLRMRFRRKLSARRERLRSGAAGRYRESLVAKLESAHMMHQFFPLSKGYIPFRLLAPFNPEAAAQERSGLQIHYVWPHLTDQVGFPPPPSMSERQLLQNGRRVLIVGPPGTGKSTLLAHLALEYLQAHGTDEAEGAGPSCLPVHLHLAEMTWRGGDYEAALAAPFDALAGAAGRYLRGIAGTGLSGMLRQKAEAGELSLFLDGWDRLAVEQRQPVARWLAALCQDLPDLPIFMVAGETGYGLVLEQGFTITGILPWRMGEAAAFATIFGRKLAFRQLPQLADYWQPGQPVLETVLRLHHFQQHGRSLRGRPDLPDIYESGLKAFGPQTAWWGEQTRALWGKIAHLLLTAAQMSLPKTAVDSLIDEFSTVGMEVDAELADTLRRSLQDSGLFQIWPHGAVAFRSGLVGDFLAAEHLFNQHDMAEVAAHIEDRRWADVLNFTVARRGGTELATPMLRAKDLSLTRKKVFRAAAWMRVAADQGEWRRQVMVLLGQMIRASSFTFILRQRALVALVMTGEPGVEQFIAQLLERSDPFLRHLGTLGLGFMAPQELSVRQLQKMLGDTDPFVRRTAVYALAPHQYDPLVEEVIVQALLSDDEAVSRAMAEMLAWNGNAGLDLLREAAEDDDLQVRRAAVFGLAYVDDAAVDALLTEMSRHDSEWVVRNAATSVLETRRAQRAVRPWAPVQPAQQRWLVDYALSDGRTVPHGAAARPYLVQIMGEAKEPGVRAAAAALLGQLPGREALPALETAVRESDPLVSEAAFATLCRLQYAYEA